MVKESVIMPRREVIQVQVNTMSSPVSNPLKIIHVKVNSQEVFTTSASSY
jgi:hypothetical protein